jgi:hypothetical protein
MEKMTNMDQFITKIVSQLTINLDEIIILVELRNIHLYNVLNTTANFKPW